MVSKIYKPEYVNIREAFRHEAHIFTVWLEENIDTLASRLGIEHLSVIEREKSVGSFNVDLLCEDNNGTHIIIENQLGKTDHDHLGKLLTYLVNLDAQIAIWITSEARSEHQRVIDWFNEITPATMAFYLVRVEAIRVAENTFIPIFNVLAGPDEQTREIGQEKKELADRHHKRLEFWEQLLAKSREQTRLFANISPNTDNWLSAGIGKSGIGLNYRITMHEGAVDMYIDVGDKETNKRIFDMLYNDKAEIEAEFGDTLDWRRLDDKKASRIVKNYNIGGLADEDVWVQLHEQMVDGVIRLDKALRKRIHRLSW